MPVTNLNCMRCPKREEPAVPAQKAAVAPPKQAVVPTVADSDNAIITKRFFKLNGYNLSKQNGVLCFALDIDEFEPLEYAFYIQTNRKYIFKQWYNNQKHIVYPISEPGKYCVVYFVRTPDGEITIEESESITFSDCDITK